jgi:hypothetical protein
MLTELIIVALAAYAVTDIWFNSSLFAEPRSIAEAWQDAPETMPQWARWLGCSFSVQVLNCRYCFSVYAAGLCVCLYQACDQTRSLVIILAVQRVLWVAHELSPKRLKLDRLQPDLEEEPFKNV